MINTSKIKALYHNVTSDEAKDFVLKNGIKADRDYIVYLSKYPMRKSPYKHSFKVEIPNSSNLHDWREMWSDGEDKEYDKLNPYFCYEGDIPLEFVRPFKVTTATRVVSTGKVLVKGHITAGGVWVKQHYRKRPKK